MLVLSRRKDESIIIGEDVEIIIADVRGDNVRLGISAPKYVPVHRKEVYEAIHGKSENKTRILIVDDDSTVRRKLIQLVNREPGFRVSAEAENANQALDAVDKQKVDLAIVDNSLEQVTEKIKSRCPNMPVLAIPISEFLKK